MRVRLPYEVARAIVPRADRSILVARPEIVRDESVLRLSSHQVRLGGDGGKLGARVVAGT